MRKFGVVIAAVALVAATPSASTIDRLVQSERDFAAVSERADMRSAFLGALADDGIVFGKEPVNGKRFWQGVPTPTSKLTWRPSYAGIASSGDLGFTTGPYELSRDGVAVSYGWYASVWRLQPDGSWKLLCDLGAAVQRPAAAPPDWSGVYARTTPPAKQDAVRSRESLLNRERDIAAEARGIGLRALYAQIATADIVLLQDGQQPAIGRDAALALLPAAPDAATWEPIAGDVARAGDFAYVYGRYRRDGFDGFYLRVWRRDGDAWRIALESVHRAG